MKIRWMLLLLSLGLFFGVSNTMAEEKSCDELIAEAEQFWDDHLFDESDKRLDQVLKVCPNRAEAYWRKGRNIYDRLEALPRDQKPKKEELIRQYRELESFADKCVELDGNDANCWLWKGIGIGRRGTTQGVLKSLFMASDVEKAWLKADELGLAYRSKDDKEIAKCGCSYGLGMFYRVVPEWLCIFPFRQIVGTCGDLKKSIEWQRKAVACRPETVEYNKELAVSLLCHGQKYDQPEEIQEAKKLLISLQSLPEIRPFNKIDKEHSKLLLADPSMACGYQRDKQQEQSKEAYDEQEKEDAGK